MMFEDVKQKQQGSAGATAAGGQHCRPLVQQASSHHHLQQQQQQSPQHLASSTSTTTTTTTNGRPRARSSSGGSIRSLIGNDNTTNSKSFLQHRHTKKKKNALPWKLDRYEKMVNSFIHSVYARPTPEQMKALFEWAHDWARANCLEWQASKEERNLVNKILEQKVHQLDPDDVVFILWTDKFGKQIGKRKLKKEQGMLTRVRELEEVVGLLRAVKREWIKSGKGTGGTGTNNDQHCRPSMDETYMFRDASSSSLSSSSIIITSTNVETLVTGCNDGLEEGGEHGKEKEKEQEGEKQFAATTAAIEKRAAEGMEERKGEEREEGKDGRDEGGGGGRKEGGGGGGGKEGGLQPSMAFQRIEEAEKRLLRLTREMEQEISSPAATLSVEPLARRIKREAVSLSQDGTGRPYCSSLASSCEEEDEDMMIDSASALPSSSKGTGRKPMLKEEEEEEEEGQERVDERKRKRRKKKHADGGGMVMEGGGGEEAAKHLVLPQQQHQ